MTAILLFLCLSGTPQRPPAPTCVGMWRGAETPTTCDCGCNWKSGAQRNRWTAKPVIIRQFGTRTCACEVKPR